MIMLVVGMYGYHLVVSGKMIRKARRLAEAAIESTPAVMTIVFDERDQVAELKMRDPSAEAYFRSEFIGKTNQSLGFLPAELREHAGLAAHSSNLEISRTTAPLRMPDGLVLYLEWEMQNFTNETGNTELKIARGYDVTTELLQTQRKLKVLSAASSEAEERERKRIAEDLHDRIGEILIASSRLIDGLKKKSSSPEMIQGLDELSGIVARFTQGTRSLIFDLVPQVLYDLGLAEALRSLAENFKRQFNISIRVEEQLQDFQIVPEIAVFLYKAIRECILNAMKHGGADEMLVTLARTNDVIEVAIEDNGSGFTSEADELTAREDAGFGLFNVKTRAEYYHGGIETAESEDLGGGRIRVWVQQINNQ
jgi:signal transduction histidine kinase